MRLFEQLEPHHATYSERAIRIEGRIARAHESHARILAAINAQDVEAAKDEALAHLRDAENDLANAAGS